MYLKTICVTVYTTCYCGVVVIITLFLHLGCTTRNVFKKKFVLRFVQPMTVIMNESYFSLFLNAKMRIC